MSKHAIGQVYMLTTRTGLAFAYAAPAATPTGAWKAARRELGAFNTLQLRRLGYRARLVTISIEEHEDAPANAG